MVLASTHESGSTDAEGEGLGAGVVGAIDADVVAGAIGSGRASSARFGHASIVIAEVATTIVESLRAIIDAHLGTAAVPRILAS
jgi:hypothetical protein